MPPVACILASVLHFRDDTLHVFRQVIGTVAYLGIGERAVIPQGLQGALADFQLQADILVVEPASRPLHAFQIQMGIPSTLCMNRSIFMANSSNAFLSKHTISITSDFIFYIDTPISYHPEKRSLVRRYHHIRQFRTVPDRFAVANKSRKNRIAMDLSAHVMFWRYVS